MPGQFGSVVRPTDWEVGNEPEDHVLVAVEPSDEDAGFGGEGGGGVVVVGPAFGEAPRSGLFRVSWSRPP